MVRPLPAPSWLAGFSASEPFQDELSSGTELTGATDATSGIARNAARSVCCMLSSLSTLAGSSPLGAPTHCWVTRNRLFSSSPVGRFTRATRSPMMNTALQTMARVSAICRAISTTPALCRRRAAIMGWSFME